VSRSYEITLRTPRANKRFDARHGRRICQNEIWSRVSPGGGQQLSLQFLRCSQAQQSAQSASRWGPCKHHRSMQLHQPMRKDAVRRCLPPHTRAQLMTTSSLTKALFGSTPALFKTRGGRTSFLIRMRGTGSGVCVDCLTWPLRSLALSKVTGGLKAHGSRAQNRPFWRIVRHLDHCAKHGPRAFRFNHIDSAADGRLCR
jgi:hypothetical protein